MSSLVETTLIYDCVEWRQTQGSFRHSHVITSSCSNPSTTKQICVKNPGHQHPISQVTKGPCLYYVSTFWDFFCPTQPPHVSINSTKSQKKIHFSDHPPSLFAGVIQGWPLRFCVCASFAKANNVIVLACMQR